jgi:replicative DNA helicase
MNRHASHDFSTTASSLNAVFTSSLVDLKKPSNIIKTGIQDLNEMLNGGFQSARVYLVLGDTGGWKSGFLLNCVKWAVEHNKIKSNDPTCRPCVLYVTQENDVNETNERIWSIIKNDTDPGDLKMVENSQLVMERFGESDWINDDPERMVAFFKYRPSRSINTADIDHMIDDIKLEGYEVRMVVHDYVKRIMPVEYTGDIRIDLGTVVDEFSTIAKNRNIPFVTASQINREGTKKIEAALEAKKNNIGQKLGISDTGESKLMIENADYVFINYIEFQASTKTWYLTMKRVKSRGRKKSGLEYIAHPFVKDNGMLLIEDINLAAKLSLGSLGDGLSIDPRSSSGGIGTPRRNRDIAADAAREGRSPLEESVDAIASDYSNEDHDEASDDI